MCPLQTPLHSPAQVLPNNSKEPSQPACVGPGTSSDENEMSDKSKKECTSSSRKDSDSDSSGSGEDLVKAPAKIPNMSWSSAFQQSLSNMLPLAQNQHEATKSQEDTICTMFYYPQKVANKPGLKHRYCQYCNAYHSAQLTVSNRRAISISLRMKCACK